MNRPLAALIGVIGLVCLSGCGKPGASIPASVSPQHPSDQAARNPAPLSDQRAEFERLYKAVRGTLDESTPDKFLQLVEIPDSSPEKIAKLRETWSDVESKNALKNFVFSDLATQEFIQVTQEGDWAGYYYLSDLEDPNRLNVNLLRLHKQSDGWKIYMRQSISSEEFDASSGKSRAEMIQDIISGSESLKQITQ